MSEIHTIAILTPAPGKVDRLRSVLSNVCEQVHAKEEHTLRYLLTEQVRAETPEFIFVETYASTDGQKQHSQTSHFKELFTTLEKEKLLGKKPYIVTTVSRAGYDLDRKLVRSKI